MSEQQKFILKVVAVLTGAFGGWAITLSTWSAGTTPVAIGGLLMIVGSVLGGVLGVTSPSATRAVDVALLTGVHTKDEVKTIVQATSPGTVVTKEVAAAILGKPAPQTEPADVPADPTKP